MARFTIPRDIYYGKDSLEMLKTFKGKRAFVVTGYGSMKKSGFLDKTVGYLKEAGMDVALFENVEPDPSIETVRKGAEDMRQFQPDWIVAIGGGSAIDAAKIMWVFYEHPETVFEQLFVPFSFPELRTKAKFAAIPSTSGTASEVTPCAVVTDYKTGVKHPLADYAITPDIAILEPAIAETMPPNLAAYTGMDALTHAFEAFVSTLNGPFTDPLALKAISTVNDYMIDSYGGDTNAREQMHYAQCLAGMAFSNALLGIAHSLAHNTGAAFSTGNVPHGCANAMYLPYVIQYNCSGASKRYGEIARYIGINGKDDAELTENLTDRIRDMNKQMKIPATLKEFGVNEAEFKEKLKTIAANAVNDICTNFNPRQITPVQMEELLTCIYYGNKVEIE